MPNKDREVLKFFAEAGMLKRVARSGWWVVGVKDSESVADHSFRCAVIAYVLSRMENVRTLNGVVMALFNDIHEARINDLHKMAAKYFELEKAEDKAFQGQLKNLPENIKKELGGLHKQYRAQKNKESIIARDADILECLIQAKEYQEHGFTEAGKFMKKAPQHLKTKSARRLWKLAKASNLNTWWESLSEFKR